MSIHSKRLILFAFFASTLALSASTLALSAQTPAPATAAVGIDQLAKPPADARAYTILSLAGNHGKSFLWTAPDGTLMSRDSLLLRGQVFETDEAVKLDANGYLVSDIIRGFTPSGDAAESFTVSNRKASWKSQVDAGSAPYSTPAYYVAQGGGSASSAHMLELLLAAPNKSIALLPGGSAHAEKLTELTVGTGALKQTVTAWALTGLAPSPFAVWATAQGKYFGNAGGFGTLPVGYESELKAMDKAQDDALAARSPALLKSLLKVPAGPVAFTHVRAFLDGTHFADDQTVLVEHGRIVAIGPAAAATVPAGSQTIDGTGKTLVPGLWDSHMHFGDDSTGPFLLSLGITSARDPGNDNQLTIARAKRRAAGELLSPTVYPSVLIDGKGPNSAQVGTVVTSEAEAIGVVDKAKADGFVGIKFYGSYNPAWVAPAAAEAHKLGLHVHGHVPAGMKPSQAIAAGYDELTHIYFVSMEAMPDNVIATSNGINRMAGTGRYMKDVDIHAEPLKSLVATMAAKHIVSDPTLVVVESLLVAENGELSPAYAPYVGTLPPATERGFRQGGLAIPNDLTRADFRASFDKLTQLVEFMHTSGVPIVAGTDGSGLELVRELELYVAAGFTPSEALAAATIVPAHNVGVDKTTGSIALGKTADLDLVEGDPSHNIGDLRNTRTIMLSGNLLDADALRAASGFSGRPKGQ